MMSFCWNSSSLFWSGCVNRYGTHLGFWSIGVALSFIGTDIFISHSSSNSCKSFFVSCKCCFKFGIVFILLQCGDIFYVFVRAFKSASSVN